MSELEGLDLCGLHKRTPYGMTNISQTQFSIARHYGGLKFQGDSYTYLPQTDELIRDDVWRWKRRQARKAKAQAPPDTTPCSDQSEK
jgi:hypothetical protein